MFVLNKRTNTIQECRNMDAVKACMKDTDHYAVAETYEDLAKKPEKKTAKKSGKGSEKEKTAGEGQKEAEGQQSEDTGTQDEEALRAMDVDALRDVAKSKGIQGCGNMDKETLVAMILNY